MVLRRVRDMDNKANKNRVSEKALIDNFDAAQDHTNINNILYEKKGNEKALIDISVSTLSHAPFTDYRKDNNNDDLFKSEHQNITTKKVMLANSKRIPQIISLSSDSLIAGNADFCQDLNH